MSTQAITITIEGSIWELLGKAVVGASVLVLLYIGGLMLFLAWEMGGWRPWSFITDRLEERRRKKRIRVD